MNDLITVDEQLITRFREQKEHAKECLNKGVEMLAEGWLTLYEISAEKSYLAEYETWEEFLEDFSHDVKDASRTLMFDRVRMVRRLKDIGWTDEQILEALKSPTVAQEALIRFAEWQRGGGLLKLANGVQKPEELEDDEALSQMVETAIGLPRGEGRKYVSETMGQDQVYARLKETDGFTAIIIVDEDLGTTYEFFCKEAISNGARNYLERKFGTRFA